jgi:beta-phosphoglucomutase-like phosphatase (HAD superfamily)
MYFFDLDGTLIDSNGVWKQVDRDFLAKRGIPYTHAYYEGVAHTALPMAAEFTKEFCHLEESCEEIIAEWMEMSRDMYSHVPLKPGVRAYLKQCKAEGRRMAIITSSVPEHCYTALKKLDLEKYFENVTFAQQAGMHKKFPDVWLQAAEKNGVFYYPILVRRETASWQEFVDAGLSHLLEGTYAGTYQDNKITQFYENLGG